MTYFSRNNFFLVKNFELQPTLENALVMIRPLHESDFNMIYEIASDPLIWEQHPTRDRYKKEVFEKYFRGAIESGTAFTVFNNKKQSIGCTRFYDLNESSRSVAIGYTFLSRDHWGSTYNSALKALMIDHAFRFVDKIIFHVGVNNLRSQKAVEKLGAIKTGEGDMIYYGDISGNRNFVYELNKAYWNDTKAGQVIL